jgi:general secretion pathway protein B
MSFILDALKKSETERQRNAGPALAEVPRSHRAPARPWWVFALGALLLVNLIVFAVVLLRGQHLQNTAPPATQPTAAVVAAPAPVAAAPVVPAPAPVTPAVTAPPVVAAAPAPIPRSETSLADEAAISAPTAADLDPSLAGASVVPGGPPIVRSLNQNQGYQNLPGQNTNSQYNRNQPAPGANDERLPSINELTGSAAMHLPDLRMDLHVFANNPAGRFVSINGRKYVEGQKLTEGPTLESITRDGVVLNNQGMRFVLPRPQ